MQDFVGYHNADELGPYNDGRPVRKGQIEWFFTAKPYREESIVGSRLWAIEGSGLPKRYHLVSFGLVTRLSRAKRPAPYKGFGLRVYFHVNSDIKPAEVTNLPWFKKLKEEQQSFRFGLSRIRNTHVVAALNRLAKNEAVAVPDKKGRPGAVRPPHRRRLSTDELLKEIRQSAGSAANSAARKLVQLSREIGIEPVPRLSSVSMRFPLLDRLEEHQWLTLFVMTTAGTFYCSWLRRWRKAGAPSKIAERYEENLRSALGRVIYHPGQFHKAVPLARVLSQWPEVRTAVKRAVLGLRRTISPRQLRNHGSWAGMSDIEGTVTETRLARRGRSRRLRAAALHRAAGMCSVCRRDFRTVLRGRGIRVLQVHHIEQLSAAEMPQITKLSDLVVVCANCHMLLHVNPSRALLPSTLRKMLAQDRRRG